MKAPHAPGKDAARAAREKRLAEALRLNLKRRKSAARAAPAGDAGDAPDTPATAGKQEKPRR